MTIAIGVLDEVGCLMVADGLGVGSGMERHEVQKIHSHLGLTFAMSGYTTGRVILESAIEVEMGRNAGNQVSLAGLSKALRADLNAREWLTDTDRGGSPPYWDLAFLLTDGHSLAIVLTDMSAEFWDDPMACIGSGIEMATGVYHYAVQLEMDVREAARAAVVVSAKYLHHCGGKVHSVVVPRGKKILVP